jgi:hypothetical protein
MLLNSSPLSLFFSFPTTELSNVIWSSTVPEVEENLKAGTFKRSQTIDVETHLLRRN